MKTEAHINGMSTWFSETVNHFIHKIHHIDRVDHQKDRIHEYLIEVIHIWDCNASLILKLIGRDTNLRANFTLENAITFTSLCHKRHELHQLVAMIHELHTIIIKDLG